MPFDNLFVKVKNQRGIDLLTLMISKESQFISDFQYSKACLMFYKCDSETLGTLYLFVTFIFNG